MLSVMLYGDDNHYHKKDNEADAACWKKKVLIVSKNVSGGAPSWFSMYEFLVVVNGVQNSIHKFL